MHLMTKQSPPSNAFLMTNELYHAQFRVRLSQGRSPSRRVVSCLERESPHEIHLNVGPFGTIGLAVTF